MQLSPIKVVAVDGGGVLCTGIPEILLNTLASRYESLGDVALAERIRKLHKTNYGAWNKIKSDTQVTEMQYLKELFQDGMTKSRIELTKLMILRPFIHSNNSFQKLFLLHNDSYVSRSFSSHLH
jgi:hypothetical protein